MNKEILRFIDLEATVIDDWWGGNPINHQLRGMFQDKELRIFSFALLNLDDLKEFNFRIKPMLEETFGCKIVDSILISDLTKEIAQKFNHLHFFDIVDEMDYRNTLGKQDMFLRFCKRFQNKEIHLWDDMVDNQEIIDKDLNNFIVLHKA